MAADQPPYRLRPLAEADIEQIWLYSQSKWSRQQADRYVRSILDAFAGLATGMRRGRAAEARAGYFKHVVGSHVVYYVEGQAGIEIVRVLHGRMDVERQL